MLHQSAVATRRQEVGASGMACHTMTQVVEFDFPAAFTAAEDVLEIAMLPARNQLLGLELISDIAVANTATVKLMDGEFGDTVEDRDLTGATIANGSINDTTLDATREDCLAIPKQNANTGIGITLSADVAAGAGKLTLIATYAA